MAQAFEKGPTAAVRRQRKPLAFALQLHLGGLRRGLKTVLGVKGDGEAELRLVAVERQVPLPRRELVFHNERWERGESAIERGACKVAKTLNVPRVWDSRLVSCCVGEEWGAQCAVGKSREHRR